MTLSHQITQATKLRDSQRSRHKRYRHLDDDLKRLTALSLITEIRKSGRSVSRKHEQAIRPKYLRATLR